MILKVIEDIEKILKDFFLTDVNFVIDGKVIKKGKIMNAYVKDFFIIFKLQVQKGGVKTFEVPYPYNLKSSKSKLIFDYKLNTLVLNNTLNFVKIKNFKPKKNSKFYDIKMYVKKNEEKTI